MTDYSSTVLLAHPSSLDPSTFLSRVLDKPVDDEGTVIPWTIDNKYYTAQVDFLLVELDHEGVIPAGVDVLIYLFETVPSTLPAGLIKNLVDEPKDIALAIRAKSDATDVASDEEWKDVFEEVGLEVIDENAQAEEDDERPISPLETIRQTLMTHLWPSMVRKPAQGANTLPAARGPIDDNVDEDEEDEDVSAQAGPSTFPISFNPSQPNATGEQLERHLDEAFPDLAELKAQIEMDDFERFETGNSSGTDRLAMLDSMFGGPGDEEYARLDEWLDADEQGGFEPLEDGQGEAVGREQGQQPRHREEGAEETIEVHPPGGDTEEDVRFDDDFDDFAAFQSAPTRSTSIGVHLTADPTPLLMHLQTVRAELAGLDEEERRIRAGKEVARVMRDLGFDDVDASDLLGEMES